MLQHVARASSLHLKVNSIRAGIDSTGVIVLTDSQLTSYCWAQTANYDWGVWVLGLADISSVKALTLVFILQYTVYYNHWRFQITKERIEWCISSEDTWGITVWTDKLEKTCHVLEYILLWKGQRQQNNTQIRALVQQMNRTHLKKSSKPLL